MQYNYNEGGVIADGIIKDPFEGTMPIPTVGRAPERHMPPKKPPARARTPRKAAETVARGKPTLFLSRLYDMVEDPSTDSAIQWNKGVSTTTGPGASPGACAFTIVDNMLLEKHWLPKFYKHANFTSFIRQLNQYQFRKLESKRWTFGHESFVKGRPEELIKITRKRKKTEGAVRPAPTGAAPPPAARVVPMARQVALEAYVARLAQELQKSLTQQAAMQVQIQDLTQRLEERHGPIQGLMHPSEFDQPAIKKQRSDSGLEDDETEEDGGYDDFDDEYKWHGLTHEESNEEGMEFAEVDIPTDIDEILSSGLKREEKVNVQQPQQPQLQAQPPNQTQPQPQPQQKDQITDDDITRAKQLGIDPRLKPHPLQGPRPSSLFQLYP